MTAISENKENFNKRLGSLSKPLGETGFEALMSGL
jgi:hypothetical protein